MSGTHSVIVGNRGRIVVPIDVRERLGLTEGTALMLIETPGGIILMTRQQLQQRVRNDLAGADLVGSLIDDRRSAAQLEDSR